MSAKYIAAGFVIIGAAVVTLYRKEEPEQFAEIADKVSEAVETVAETVWQLPKNAAKYWPTIVDAANNRGIPPLLLARLLYQESRFRDDIISGKTASPAGALGIAQFMPATAKELGIDPLNPYASIHGAAQYLAKLYTRFGNWPEALAAYNWGQGNVSRKGLAVAPTETKNYVSQILADVGSILKGIK